MARSVRDFMEELGGYRYVAGRLGVAHTTLHGYMMDGSLPPRFYLALCDLAREKAVMPPAPDLFDFKPLICGCAA